MPKHWTSRKFIASLVAQITAVIVLMWPEHESEIVEASKAIAALLVLGLSALGYICAEASVDRQRAMEQPPARSPAHPKETS